MHGEYRIKANFFLLASSLWAFVLSPSLGFADAAEDAKTKEGESLCRTHWDKKDPNDPCNEAYLMQVGADVQEVTASVYSIATGVCTTVCLASFASFGIAEASEGVCTTASIAGLGADITGTIFLATKGGDLASSMASMAPSLMGTITSISTTATSGKVTESGGEKTKDFTGACVAAGFLAVNTAIRWTNHIISKGQRDDAFRKKVDLMPKDNPVINTLGTSGGGGGSGSGGVNPTQNDPTRNLANTKEEIKKDPVKMAESAASAGFGPYIKKYEEMTGKPAADVFDKVANGHMDPFSALAQSAGATLGPQGLQGLGELAASSKDLIDKNKDKLSNVAAQSKVDQAVFASTNPGSKSSHGGGLQMPDFSKLMAGLLPKKEEKQVPVAQGNLGFQNKPQVTKEGFHSAEKSLFDIVGARYQSVQGKFLAGSLVINPERSPASLVPANPYLGK